MLKEQLLKEAATMQADVELDSVFEGMNLSDAAKGNFRTVFEAAVKSQAVKLAESHITRLVEFADQKADELQAEAEKTIEAKLYEDANNFFNHLAKEWMAENALAVDRGLKAELFESMFSGLKDLFVEHNVVVPEDAVDVVAEMEDELAERQAETTKLFESKILLEKEVADLKRTALVEKNVADLTEGQKDKVSSLIEGLEYSDKFEGTLTAIVEMVKTSGKEETKVTESNINTDDIALNFIVEKHEEDAKPSNAMDQYVRAANFGS